MRTKITKQSDFYCTQCGKYAMTLPRPLCHQRAGGHLKKLYCPHCRQEHNCVEIPEKGRYTKETFLEEFYGGRFTADGLRKETITDVKQTCVIY